MYGEATTEAPPPRNMIAQSKIFCDRYSHQRLIDTLVPDSKEYWEAIALLGKMLLKEDSSQKSYLQL